MFLDVDCPSVSDKIPKNPANSDLSLKSHFKPKSLTEVPRHLTTSGAIPMPTCFDLFFDIFAINALL